VGGGLCAVYNDVAMGHRELCLTTRARCTTACFIYDLPGGRGSYATEIHSDMVSVFIQFGFNSCWSGSHSLGGLLNSPSV